MHYRVKSEQCFAVTGARRVAVFQASLVREEAGFNSPTMTTNVQHPKDQNVYEKKDAVNKNDALIWQW